MKVMTIPGGELYENCYFAMDSATGQIAVIDPGFWSQRLEEAIRRAGPQNIKMILLTHGHFDHIMAANELREKWHVPVYACKKELDILGDWEKNLVASYFDTPYTVTPDITVEEGDTFSAAGFTWQVFETPGHTIGSCCYYIEKEKVLFSGDTLFSGSYGRTDLPTGSGRMMISSVTRLLKSLPEDVMVYPGHMDETTIGYEKKNNPLARFLK